MVVRQGVVARAHREETPDDRQRLPQGADVGVRPEVAGAGEVDPAHHEDPGKRLTERDGDARVALVVREPDVEARFVLLDQIVLEQQRLCLSRHHDGFEIGDLPGQRRALRRLLHFGGEVRGHPRPQALGLADVEDLARGVLPEIDAGTVRQGV